MSLLIAGLANTSQTAKTANEEEGYENVDSFEENKAQVEAGQDPSKKNDGDTKDEKAAEKEKKDDDGDDKKKEAGLSIAQRMGKVASRGLQGQRAENFSNLKNAVLKTAASQAASLSASEKEIVGCTLNAALTKIACEVDFADVTADEATVDYIVKVASEMADDLHNNFSKPRE